MCMKWVAKLEGVLDVTLTGSAVPDLWRQRLPVPPLEAGGRARVMMVAAAARFGGIPFQEWSLSVLVEGGAFLVQAFNSRRLFAWSERTFFRTPYRHAAVSVSESAVSVAGLFLAQRGSREPSSVGADAWNGRVMLGAGRHFFASIEGGTERYPFTDADTLLVHPSLPGFTPDEWLVRRAAMHEKSRTYFGAGS